MFAAAVGEKNRVFLVDFVVWFVVGLVAGCGDWLVGLWWLRFGLMMTVARV